MVAFSIFKMLKKYLSFLVLLILLYVTMFIIFKLDLEKSSYDIYENEEDLRIKYFKRIAKAFQRMVPDNSGKYSVIMDLLPSLTVDQEQVVTLTTHATINHLTKIINITNHWFRPVSFSIFLMHVNDIVPSLIALASLKNCHPEVERRVSFHLIFQRGFRVPDTFFETLMQSSRLSCVNISNLINKELINGAYGKEENYGHKVSYPVNLARNVAWKGSKKSLYILPIDVDLTTSPNLYKNFKTFLKTNQWFCETDNVEQYAFVVPAFEKKHDLDPPRNKAELIKNLIEGNVRRFNVELCQSCHNGTKYNQWISMSLRDDFSIAYPTKYSYHYEPYLFMRKEQAPFYDERFVQYGSNRLSQVCEMHVSGHKLAVLNNAFLMHESFKFKRNLHSNWHSDMMANIENLKKFQKELAQKYPDSNRTC